MPSFVLRHANTNGPLHLLFVFIKMFIYNCKMNKTRRTLKAEKSWHCHVLSEINYYTDLRKSKEWELLLPLFQ
jgi:hypothetical protein